MRIETQRQAAAVAANPSLLEQINRLVASARRAAAEGELSVGEVLEQHKAASAALTSGGPPLEEEDSQPVPLHYDDTFGLEGEASSQEVPLRTPAMQPHCAYRPTWA